MIILDVETTGTDPIKHSLLSIGAVDFNNPKEEFYGECRMWEGAHVMDEALDVNGFTKVEIVDSKKKTETELVSEFLAWVSKSRDHTMAGQNPFFDVGFVQAACARARINFPLAHRIVDLHSVCYAHMVLKGLIPPTSHGRTNINSDSIMQYVGIPAEIRPHNALNGAKIEAEAFSRLLYNKSFYTENA